MKKKIKNTFYNKLIGYLIKKGIKKNIQQTLNNAFFILCKKFKFKPSFLLLKIFLRLDTYVEAKTFKKRRRVLVIPFPLKIRRRIHLVLKWYTFSILNCKSKISILNKIIKITYSIITKTKSKSFDLQKANYNLAKLNRSNMHFRW